MMFNEAEQREIAQVLKRIDIKQLKAPCRTEVY